MKHNIDSCTPYLLTRVVHWIRSIRLVHASNRSCEEKHKWMNIFFFSLCCSLQILHINFNYVKCTFRDTANSIFHGGHFRFSRPFFYFFCECQTSHVLCAISGIRNRGTVFQNLVIWIDRHTGKRSLHASVYDKSLHYENPISRQKRPTRQTPSVKIIPHPVKIPLSYIKFIYVSFILTIIWESASK